MSIVILKGNEFVRRVLAGERDFSRIKLMDLDLSEHQYDTFVELNEYLKTRDLKQEPIIFNESELSFIKAGGLWLPYVKANRTSFKEGYFSHANFRCGEFPRASFYKTNLEAANCEVCDFYNAYFKDTDLYQTKLGGARFKFADLVGVRRLGEAIDLAYAQFEHTLVTPEDRETILSALRRREDFEKFDFTKLFRSQPSKPPT